ncbi:DUF3892 domain-containing protein [Clostridium saccharobutylicum]|uniref:DUF3892 domain-containing protein n=1 Tax=Clostridium saccharobutylicum TaxID=169679 RepID=A0A1S8N5N8_CLOSA|nr:DUF3892 domain-containing protein [Clostridium saccharobutylicum]OOM11735.1 hypothetical protein CLOSAC_21620 [Clostridium saccharobutylicum]
MEGQTLNNSNIISGDLKSNITTLPNNINIENTTNNNNTKESITALVKHGGEVVGYELSNGQKISKEQGVQLARNDGINGVTVAISRKGEEYLRSLPDQDENNNLKSLPIINE